MTRRSRALLHTTVLATVLVPRPLLAYYTDYYFVGPSGSLYSDPANWTPTPDGPGGAPPGDSDIAYVAPSTAFTVTLDRSPVDNTANQYATLKRASFVGASPDAPLTVNVTLATSDTYFDTTRSLYLDGIAIGPNVTFNHTTGRITADLGSASISGPNTTYNLSGSAYLSGFAGVSFVGATVSQSGGTVRSDNSVNIAASSYSLSGGSINGDDVLLDSSLPNTFTQTGGGIGGYYTTVIGRNTSYVLSAGTLRSPGFIQIGGKPFQATTSFPDTGTTLTQTGGTVQLADDGNYPSLVIDATPGSTALYAMSGGTLDGSGDGHLYIGKTTSGTLAQSGGSAGAMGIAVGYEPGSTGTYLLSGNAQVSAAHMEVGFNGSGSLTLTDSAAVTLSFGLTVGVGPNSTGSVTQTGGSVRPRTFANDVIPPSTLTLAGGTGSSASYTLTAGTLNVSTPTGVANYFGYAGSATVNQTGGTLDSSSTPMVLASQPGSSATYSLSGGTLSAATAVIADQGAATFSQSGGSASFGSFTLANTSSSSATLNLTGGTLAVTSSYGGPTSYVGYAGSATVNQTGGTLDASESYLTLASQPSSAATYNLSGTGVMNLHLLTVGQQGTATFNQTGGSIYTDSRLTVAAMYNQSGGVNSAFTATLVGTPSAPARYNLAGGSLLTHHLYVNDAATLSQTGGDAFYADVLTINSASPSAPAVFALSGTGSTGGDSIEIGTTGTGTFLQSGGTVDTGYGVALGTSPGSHGRYTLSAGTLTNGPYGLLTVGAQGDATFTQSGGAIYLVQDRNTGLVLASDGIASATYTMTGGSVGPQQAWELPDIIVARAGSATFSQSGGTISSIRNLTLASLPGSAATYALSGGSLSADTATIADQGSATFSQSGGTFGLTSNLILANSPSAQASYSLSAGTVYAHYLVNHGTFSMTGGLASFGTATIGPGATFAQTGGHSYAFGFVVDGTAATLLLGGDAVLIASPGDVSVGASTAGTFTQTGGETHASGLLQFGGKGAAIVQFSGGTMGGDATVLSSDVSATFLQTGGHHGSEYGISVGSNALYSLSGGTLSTAGTLSVGSPAGSGTTFQQAGGQVLLNDDHSALLLDGSTLARATYALAAGTLSTRNTTVGSGQTGYLLQTGGSHTTSSLTIAAQPGASGIYDLLAGSLTAGTVTNNGTFYMQPAASFTLTGPTFTNAGSATFDGQQSWPAGSTFSNTLVAFFHSDPGSPTAATLNVTSASPDWAPVVFDAPATHLASLALSSATHASVPAATGTGRLLSTGSLSITDTAQLDLANNTLVIAYGTSPSPADTIRNYLLNAHLTSSTSDSTHRLGYLDTSTFSGEPTAPSSLLVHLTLTGDTNFDGVLNADDYALLDAAYAAHRSNAHWTDGDFNYDGTIDQNDYLLIDSTYGQSHGLGPSLLSTRESQFGDAYVQSLIGSVPEPTTLFAACGLAPLLLSRRRRTR